MDDQQTYLLNGLLARQFGLGRVVRFRSVTRGRQAAAYEIFTVQEREYLVQLLPPAFDPEGLEEMALKVNTLDRERFSVVPFVAGKNRGHVGEGPQGSRMMVSLAPAGSAAKSASYTAHEISQFGLRLGWMHRLLEEQFPVGDDMSILPEVAARALEGSTELLDDGKRREFAGLLSMPLARGWVHGDVQPEALLLDQDRQLRTVVDWGLLHVGSPLEDLVDAFLTLCVDENAKASLERGGSLMEAYGSLRPVKKVAWTPVVARWCAQRLYDAALGRRELPARFEGFLRRPEGLATAIASCV